MERRTARVLVFLTALVLAGPAFADVLLLHGGAKIETRGEFEVKGERVVYTDSAGSLRSLPLEDVDLVASREYEERMSATADSESAEDAEPATPRLVLRQGDVPSAEEAERRRADLAAAQRRQDLASGKANLSDPGALAGSGRSRRGGGGGQADSEGFATIASWSLSPSRQTGGVQILGTVTNPSEKALDRVEVQVLVRDPKGKLLRSSTAFVDRTRLKPGWSSPFHFVDTSFNSTDDLVVEFRVTARVLSWGARPRGGR